VSRTSLFRPSASTPLPHLGVVQVGCTGILWGTGGLAVVLVRRNAELSALTISAYRTGIAAVVVLAVVLAMRRGPGVWQVLARSPVRAVGVGLLTGTYQGLYFVSVVAVGVTVSTVVSLGLAPVLLTGVASLRTRTAPSPRAAVVVVAALAGLVLAGGSSGAGITGPRPLLGILAALGSGHRLRRRDRARGAPRAGRGPAGHHCGDHDRGHARPGTSRPCNSGYWRKRRGHH